MNFNLNLKSNEVLVSELKAMVADERRLLIQILHYLREVEARKLYVSRGFKNLFLFATQELGYSAGAAGRRIRQIILKCCGSGSGIYLEGGSKEGKRKFRSYFNVEEIGTDSADGRGFLSGM